MAKTRGVEMQVGRDLRVLDLVRGAPGRQAAQHRHRIAGQLDIAHRPAVHSGVDDRHQLAMEVTGRHGGADLGLHAPPRDRITHADEALELVGVRRELGREARIHPRHRAADPLGEDALALLRRQGRQTFEQRIGGLLLLRPLAGQLQLRAAEQLEQQFGAQALVAQLREQARRTAEFEQHFLAPDAGVAIKPHGRRRRINAELDRGRMFLARVGAQLHDALVHRPEHRLHGAPAFLEFAGDAAPLRMAVFVGGLRIAQPAGQGAHHLDRLPGRHREQVEAQVIGQVALEVAHHLARLRLLAEQAAGGLAQVVQRFLDLARAQRVADVAVAAAIALGMRQVALRQARLDLLQQRQHEFQPALAAVVEQGVQALAHPALEAVRQFAGMALDAVFAGLGGGAGLADRIAFELRQQLGHFFAPQLDVVGRHDPVHLELDPAFHALEQRAAVAVQQQRARQRVLGERRQVHRTLAQVGELVERPLGHLHLLAHEGVALGVAGAPGRHAVRARQPKEGLHHQRRQFIGADVFMQALLGVEHRLAEAGVHLRVRQPHVAEARLGHARVVRPQLVLLLVDRHRALAVGEIGRGEVFEQRVGHHLVDILDVERGLVGQVGGVDEIHVVVGRAAAGDAVRVQPRDIGVHVAHRRLEFHQRGVGIGLGALLVGLGETGRHQQHQVDLAVGYFLARDRLRQPAQVEHAAGAGAAGA